MGIAATVFGGLAAKSLGAGRLAGHHIFPRNFRGYFTARGIDIDQYTVTLGHETSHLKGVHRRGLGKIPGKWNDRWAEFIKANPNATAKKVFQFAGKLMDEFGLSHIPLHPYRK